MKLKNANAIRARYMAAIMKFVAEELGEDCGVIASNSFNFPVVEDGEEGGVEIVIKVPKEDEIFDKREEYAMKVKEKEEKAKAAAEAKAKKIAKDRKRREKKREEAKEEN